MDKTTLYTIGVFNKRVVDNLIGLDDPLFIQELIDIYKKQTPIYLEELTRFSKEHNAWEMRQILHKMRSTCGTVGASSMLRVVDIMREDLLEEDWPAVNMKLIQMKEVWAATHPYLQLIFNLV